VWYWARLSDRAGRRPVLVIGCLGEALSVAAFGFARTLPEMLVSRLLLGALSANNVVLKSIVAELVDAEDRGRIFLMMPIGFSIGGAVGPM
jgi:MFS family permease